MEIKSEDVARSTRFSGFNQRRVYAEALSGFKWRKGSVAAFSGVQMEMELKIVSGMRSLGLSSVHVSP